MDTPQPTAERRQFVRPAGRWRDAGILRLGAVDPRTP
jgi:hypothetical protein